MAWNVYVLKSQKNGTRYVGISENVGRRLAEHNAGKSKFTSGHVPWELFYVEDAQSSTEARSREKYLKSAAGRRFLNKLDE